MRDYNKIASYVIDWIQNWFKENGPDSNAIVPLSGGKDSTICAALCVKALGKERVIGVGIPDNGQSLNDADEIADFLGIKFIKFPIGGLTNEIHRIFKNGSVGVEMAEQTEQNIPPRLRMVVAFAIAQSMNGRVCCCDNYSENFIGYSTFGGDDFGSFSPIGDLLVTEVKNIGYTLGIPKKWVDKVPDDGLPHSTPDEEKLKFTYDVLDKYIATSICDDPETKERIDKMHKASQFKRDIINIPTFKLQEDNDCGCGYCSGCCAC